MAEDSLVCREHRLEVAGFADLTDKESAAVGQWISRLSRALRLSVRNVSTSPSWAMACPISTSSWFRGGQDDVSWLHGDDWDGACRGNFAAAEAMAGQIRDTLDAAT